MSNKRTVYLAGPITGLSWGQATGWREAMTAQLADNGIIGLSPLRSKTYLQEERHLGDEYKDHPLSTARGLTTRDRMDCMNSDMVFMNLIGATEKSIGTMIEVGWADAARVPIVVAMEAEGAIHDHAMVRECAGFRVETLDEGLDVLLGVLAGT